MRIVTSLFATTVLLAGFGLGGCTPKATPGSIPQGQVGQVIPVQYGTVSAVRAVEIRPGQTRLGALTGAALGGIAGSQVGSSTAANVAGAITGGVAGGAIGSAVQGSARSSGIEVTVSLDSGESVSIVQYGDPRDFRPGDRVRVGGAAGNARVTR